MVARRNAGARPASADTHGCASGAMELPASSASTRTVSSATKNAAFRGESQWLKTRTKMPPLPTISPSPWFGRGSHRRWIRVQVPPVHRGGGVDVVQHDAEEPRADVLHRHAH